MKICANPACRDHVVLDGDPEAAVVAVDDPVEPAVVPLSTGSYRPTTATFRRRQVERHLHKHRDGGNRFFFCGVCASAVRLAQRGWA